MDAQLDLQYAVNMRNSASIQAAAPGCLVSIKAASGPTKTQATSPGPSNNTTSPPATPTPSAATINKYSACVKQAGANTKSMQKCASLLNGF